MTGMTDGLRTVVTLGFVVTGVWCLVRCVDLARSRRLGDRIGYGAHALMSGSMIAMVWSPPWLAGWQMAVFAVGCAWFVIEAVGVPVTSLRLAPDAAASAVVALHRGLGGRLRCVHHAVSMAIMVWMFHALSSGTMAVPGMTMPASRSLTPVLATTGGVYAVTAAALLAVATLAAPRPTRWRMSAGDDAVHAAMTGGMAVMLLAIA